MNIYQAYMTLLARLIELDNDAVNSILTDYKTDEDTFQELHKLSKQHKDKQGYVQGLADDMILEAC